MSHVDAESRRRAERRSLESQRNGYHISPTYEYSTPLSSNTGKRVIIIGAGAAGLAAAAELNALIIEPFRIGGRIGVHPRIRQQDGALWWHTPERSALRAFPAFYNSSVSPDNLETIAFINGRRADTTTFYNTYDQMDSQINCNRSRGLSLEDLLIESQISYMGAAARNWFCDADAAVKIDQVSADACKFEHATNDGHIFIAGLDQIFKQLFSDTLERTPVLEETQVTEIHQYPAHPYRGVVKLKVRNNRTGDEEWLYAEDVVFTPSIEVLKQGKIKFFPELPQEYKDGLDGIEMGTLEKFFLKVPESFFIDNSIEPNSQIHLLDANNKPLFVFARPAGEPCLVVLTGGKQSRKMLSMTKHEMANYFLTAFRQAYGSKFIIEEIEHTAWLKNEYVLGSYGAEKPGYFGARAVFEKPFGNVHFSGTDYAHSPWAGGFPAALISGQKVGRRISGKLAFETRNFETGQIGLTAEEELYARIANGHLKGIDDELNGADTWAQRVAENRESSININPGRKTRISKR